MTPLYVWYSPKLDRIELITTPECKDYDDCQWDTCAYIKFTEDLTESGAFYYIGEF